MTDDQLSIIENAIWDAQPHTLAAAAVRAIADHFGVDGAEIFLADYRLSFLVPATYGEESIQIDGTPAGRSFASQRPVITAGEGDECELYVPMSLYGDRVGVMGVYLPRIPSAAEQERFAAIAAVVARALKVADQHTDLYQRIKRRSRLTLPAEIQWGLLPARSCVCDEYHLAGMLEPAYAIWGDNFDWSAGRDTLIVSVTNGMGRGTEAALLTHLAVSALRNARRSGGDIIDQATLANETVYTQHRGHSHLSTLLLRFDLDTGQVAVVDAGSPQIFRLRGKNVSQIELEAQMPLGMFEDTEYTEQEFTVEPGDRLIIVSDGVHTAQSPAGDVYGASALPSALRQTRLQDPSEAVRTMTRGLIDYHEGSELLDDAVILCIDWKGRA